MKRLGLLAALAASVLLDAAGCGPEIDVANFKRYGSSRKLYHFHIDNLGSY